MIDLFIAFVLGVVVGIHIMTAILWVIFVLEVMKYEGD